MLLTAVLSFVPQGELPPRDLGKLLASDPRCEAVLARREHHRLQVLLAEPVEREDGSIGLVRSSFGDSDRYFYPASSIKLCGAIAALLHLNAHTACTGPRSVSTANS